MIYRPIKWHIKNIKNILPSLQKSFKHPWILRLRFFHKLYTISNFPKAILTHILNTLSVRCYYSILDNYIHFYKKPIVTFKVGKDLSFSNTTLHPIWASFLSRKCPAKPRLNTVSSRASLSPQHSFPTLANRNYEVLIIRKVNLSPFRTFNHWSHLVRLYDLNTCKALKTISGT